ncbi:hypothetical protein H7170_00445 [Candidatus Gracilibacteria bacterium]|nr:hypothetical protein [Candidatus Gracilibacteria bacterium]
MKQADCCTVEKLSSLLPLYLLLMAILVLSIVLTSIFPSNTFMMYLMGTWFLSFGIFKLIDIRSFAKSFAQYDIIARAWHGYGYIFPFVEIGIGLIYILNTGMIFMTEINLITLVVSLLGIISAYQIITTGKVVVCACMGTYWKLPMTKVTLIENLAMFLMVLYMLIYPESMMSMSMSESMDMSDSTTSHMMQVDKSTIISSEMMTPVSSDDAAMRDHCRTMPAMAGCEKFR